MRGDGPAVAENFRRRVRQKNNKKTGTEQCWLNGSIARRIGPDPANFLQKKYEYLPSSLIFAPQNRTMDLQQQEYHEELQKVQDRDFTHNWVSSSAFLFYLSIFCLLAFMLGSCYHLYTERFKNNGPEKVTIQESTQYTPKYSTPK